jgi:hypothetical protein
MMLIKLCCKNSSAQNTWEVNIYKYDDDDDDDDGICIKKLMQIPVPQNT